MADNSAFMSYRRGPGYPWARLLWGDLVDRGVDAFLDLESMRTAGRFDERLLHQIASRPYFVVVLTEGTLERCSDADDWLRREIEHAIDTGRIIVPVFIAPFEPAGFPPDLPTHVEEALSQSQGLTVYSQYLTAAVDKLVDELLTPVDLESAALTEEDARFHSRTIREIMSLPAPTVPATPTPSAPSAPTSPSTGPVDAGRPELRAAAAPPRTPAERGTATTAPAEPEPVATAPVQPTEPEPVATAPAEPETEPVATTPVQPTEPEPAPVGPPRHQPAVARPAPHPEPRRRTSRRGLLVGGVAAVALVAILGIVGVLSSGGDDGSSRSASVEQRPPTVPGDRDNDDSDDSETDTDPPDGGIVHDERLLVNEWLRPGDVVRSGDGAHELVMTADGRLQLMTGEAIVWAPSYSPTSTASAVLQGDGNFVVYRADDDRAGALWASGTTSVGDGARLEVVDEAGRAVVAIFDRAGDERWREPADVTPDAAAEELRNLIAGDRPEVESGLEGWVVQLSVKRDGQEEDGIWDHDRILAEHVQLRQDVGAVLVDGGDYNLDLPGTYVSLLVGRFGTKEDAQQWCRDERPGDCGVKFLSADPDAPTQSWFDT